MLLITTILYINNAYAANKCEIIYGLHDDYKPYEWLDDKGIAKGINIDIIKAVAREASCSLRTVSYDWSTMLEMLNNNEITMVSASLNPSREAYSFQLPPNGVLYRYFFTRQAAPNIDNINDATDKIILVQKASVADNYISSFEKEKNITILRYLTKHEVIDNLSESIGDAALLTIEGAENVFAKWGYSNIKMSSQPLIPTLYGFIMNKNDFELYQNLHVAMEKLKFDGSYYDIIKKWRNKKDYSSWVKNITAIAIILVAITFIILLWNTQLHAIVKRKTEQNNKLRDEALMVSRLSALGEMASNVAHEINNPTGLIIHNMDFIQKVNADVINILHNNPNVINNAKIIGSNWQDIYPEYMDSFKTVNDNLLRIVNSVNDLKDYSREQSKNNEVVDLRKSLELAIKFTTFFIKKHTNSFSFQIDEGEYFTYGNSMHIEQVIINVVQNACYALNPLDGEIRCTLKKAENNYTLISIKDNGKGMSKEVLDNILTPFFTTRRESGGTGLGLSITARIVAEHKGVMKIESKLGEGTTVNIFLPNKI